MTELWLVRHGETDWNRQRRVQGMLNIGLNDVGRRQALMVAEHLAGVHGGEAAIDAIHSSDLDRAHDTARPTAERIGLPVTLDAGLRERCYGICQGLTFDELGERHPEVAAGVLQRQPDYEPDGGESPRRFQRRVVAALEAIAARRRGARVLVFTHSGVIDMAYRHAAGVPLEAPRPHALTNVSINRLAIGDGGWRILGWAETGHV
ncbi:histidine phosphatase family protein [Pigmentiphaga soli]|uniref:Histidine phosphatase family protein n=1 Tax=Pigmentiphaga soli TaxID=1007095 RepID=A0ABP8GTE4_9BURK